MSETDYQYDPECDPEFNGSVADYDSTNGGEGQFINERFDRYSDETSSYHISTYADPSSKNKRYVMRYNPTLKKKVRVGFFETKPNSIIKNAVTGTFQGANAQYFKSGTKQEDLFFSVMFATGEVGPTGVALFYDSPEQYERHFFIEVPQQIKDRWMQKRDRAFNSLKMFENRMANSGDVVVK